MRPTAIVVAPGRGTYNRTELGYLARNHASHAELIARFDVYRNGQGQETLAALDSAARFSGAKHTRGDNASALIYAAAYLDFLAINRARYDILGVCGNSMGWYIALACAGALGPMEGLEVVNTMGTLMNEHGIGGQLVYPFVNENWHPIPDARRNILEIAARIDAHPNHRLGLSIDLGGMLVLAGNDTGLAAFEKAVPRLQDRYPMRIPNHAAFHTNMQEPVAAEGRKRLPVDLFAQPVLPLIDGRGSLWWPHGTDPARLRNYTLGHQVVAPYDFAAAIRSAAYEFMPDVFIVLGPGTTLSGSVAQSLTAAAWRDITNKTAFQRVQSETPRIVAMGRKDQRHLATGTV